MSKGKKNKKKKEKVTYYDDGRTVADMSNVGGRRYYDKNGNRRASFKEQRKTYFKAVRMMFLPMLVTIGIISLAFLIVWLMLVL